MSIDLNAEKWNAWYSKISGSFVRTVCYEVDEIDQGL